MPPKAKFQKTEIVEAALSIVRSKGFPALTARALGAQLGSSARPIFTVFQSMEEVQQAVLLSAKKEYGRYVQEGLSQPHPFKGVGTQYILFAIHEPKLFQLLFMKEQENIPDIHRVLPMIDESYEPILRSIQEEYAMDHVSAQWLYQHLWVYTHGIAALCATKMCRFTGDEISQMMTEVFTCLLKQRKARVKDD